MQYKTVYKKSVHTRNVTLTLNLTDSLNVTDPRLALNLSRVLHTIQVGVGPETSSSSSRRLSWW